MNGVEWQKLCKKLWKLAFRVLYFYVLFQLIVWRLVLGILTFDCFCNGLYNGFKSFWFLTRFIFSCDWLLIVFAMDCIMDLNYGLDPQLRLQILLLRTMASHCALLVNYHQHFYMLAPCYIFRCVLWETLDFFICAWLVITLDSDPCDVWLRIPKLV